MKKTILAIATLAILSIANVNAQRSSYPVHSAPQINNPRLDNKLEELSINHLDNIVKLSRKQENEIKRIENQYDRLLKGRRLGSRDIERLQNEKQKDIWSVLTPAQRERLVAYQHSRKFDRNPYRRG